MKNKHKPATGSGVSFSYEVEANERIKIPFFSDLMLCLLVMIAAVGAIMTFVTILDLKIVPSVAVTSIVAFSVIYTVLYKLVKKRHYLVIVGAAAVAGLIALLFWKNVSEGVAILVEQARIAIYSSMQWQEFVPTYEWRDDFFTLTNFVLVLLSGVLCAAIGYFTVVKQRFIAIFLLTFPFFEIGAAFGAVPNYTYFSMMLASWAASLTVSRVSNAKIKVRRSNGEKQKTNIGGSTQKFAGIAVVIALSVVLLFTAVTTYLNAIDFTRAESTDVLRRSIKVAYADIVDYITGEDHDGSLKDGKLYKVDDRVIKNRHYMTMTTTVSSTEEPIKIKGFTATIYKENCWNQTDQYDKYQAMFDEFKETGYAAYMMGVNTGFLAISSPEFTTKYFSDITMSNFRRKKPYAYETYFANFSDYEPVYDSYVAPTKKSEYSYPAFLSERYLAMVPSSISYQKEDFQAAFARYAEFVNQEYVKSQTTDRVKALAMSFEAADKYEYINKVRAYLEENMEHTMLSGKCPEGIDFVENFLFNTKKGYSTHFASAAAVLLQARGYATRYIEGYYIPVDVFNNTPSDRMQGYKTIDITDQYAHAWIEVFDETYGWIPVEVTPGYWSGDFSQPELSSDSQEEEPPETDTPPSSEEQINTNVDIVEEDVENDVDEEFDPPADINPLWLLAAIPLLLVIAAATLFVIHLVIVLRRKRVYASGDVDAKLKYAYKYLVALARYQKIKIGNTYDHAALAEYIGTRSTYIGVYMLQHIFNVLLKHTYSQAPATVEEANEILKELRAYSNAIYADLTKGKKFVYKYLHNL